MTIYSVADAKNGLPKLIDRALDGEEVVISRHGRSIVELRPHIVAIAREASGTYDWLRRRRDERRGLNVDSVQLLNSLYEDPDD